MEKRDDDDVLFSAGKPKSFPWFYIPVIAFVATLVFLYKWFT